MALLAPVEHGSAPRREWPVAKRFSMPGPQTRVRFPGHFCIVKGLRDLPP